MDNFKGTLLSSWNSVSGPKICHIWFLNNHPLFYLPGEHFVNIKCFDIIKEKYSFIFMDGNESFTNQNLNFPSLIQNVNSVIEDLKRYLKMSGKLLLTEMETKRPFIQNCTRLYQLEDKIIFAIIFCKQFPSSIISGDLENSCLCLSLMFTTEKLKILFKIQTVIDLHMRYIISDIQKLANENFTSEKILNKFKQFCEAVETITMTNNLNEIQYFPRFSQFQLRVKFLSRAIASHLQTSGCSVVVGASPFTVNQVAMILLLFNSKKEKYCSVPVIKSSQGTCYRGLQVQGHVRDYNEWHCLELPEEYYNTSSITVIDTDSYKVRQNLCSEFQQNNRKSLKTVTDSGKLIPGFLQNMFLCEEHKLKIKSLLNDLRRLIHIKSVALIKLIEGFRNNNCSPTVKQLMTLMDVTDFYDFKIYMGCAEKLKPGLKTFVS